MKIRELDSIEQRVTGALLEKALTTPEYYPLTLNTLVAACNQKTNRYPVTDYSQAEVGEALDRLRHDALTWRKEGARATRWETTIVRRLELTEEAVPIIGLLLLRGPQTPGELRARSGRMREYESLQDIEGVLHELSSGDHPLVFEMGRQPGQKETRWMHLVGGQAEDLEEQSPVTSSAPPRDSLSSRVARLERLVEQLREEIDRLVGVAERTV